MGPGRIEAAFSSAARVALFGLVLPPVILALASQSGLPLRSGVASLRLGLGLAGFCAAGAWAGTAFDRGWRATAGFAAGMLAAGMLVVPAIQSLQGLSGREPILIPVGLTLGGFAAGFGLAGFVGPLGAKMSVAQARRLGVHGILAGLVGGGIALGPAVLARGHLTFPGAYYLDLFVAVGSFLLCIFVPFRWIGRIAGEQIGLPAAKPGLGLSP